MLVAVLALLALLPVVAAPHLLLLDAPAHEARLAVLRDLLITGHGSPFYYLDTFFLPNIAFDLIGLGLSVFAPPELAGRIFFGLCLLLTASGIATLNRVATGRWNLAPLASVLLLYNLVSILGFFSYIFGLALVPWALAGRLKLEGRAPAIGALFGVAVSVLLLFCHVFDFGIYAVMSVGFALTAWHQKRIGFCQALMRAVESVPAGVLFLMMSTGSRSRISYDPHFLSTKLMGLAKSLTSGSLSGDVAFMVGAISFALLLLLCSRPRLVASFVPGLIGLVILYFVLPAKMASGSYVDVRMPIAIALLALAGLDVQFRPAKMTVALLALFGAAFLAKQTAIAALWRSFSAPANAVVRALDALPEGAIILQSECLPHSGDILNVYRARQPAMQHLSSLSNFDASRFVAELYAIAGQQPIRVSPFYLPYFRLQTTFAATCDASDYRSRVARIQGVMRAQAAAGHAVPPLFLVLFRPPPATSLQPEARLLSKSPIYALYEIAAPGR
ncbi:MAG: hypothetical protein ABI608_01540 [Rhizomicrobium sp.]